MKSIDRAEVHHGCSFFSISRRLAEHLRRIAALDARHPPDALLDRVQAMLERSPTTGVTGEPAEEWAIFDPEGFGRRVDQFESLEGAHLSATARAGIS